MVIIILAIFRKKPTKKIPPASIPPPDAKYKLGYKRVENIFTASERKFLATLQQAIGTALYIFAKVDKIFFKAG